MGKLYSKKEKIFLDIVGILLLVVGVVGVILSIYQHDIDQIFWLCYVMLIISGIGSLRRNSIMILSQLNITLVPSIFWMIDFFYHVFTKGSLFGLTNDLFVKGNIIRKIISLQHLYAFPLLLCSLYVIKIENKKAWIFSFIEIVIFFFLSLLLTNPLDNINCVFKSCISSINFGGLYFLTWFLCYGFIILVTNYVLFILFRKMSRD